MPVKAEIVCRHTFTEWISSVMEYDPLKSMSYDRMGLLSRSTKCAGTLLRCYIAAKPKYHSRIA